MVRRPLDVIGEAQRMLPHEALGLRLEQESELVRETNRPQEPQRIIDEDPRRDGADCCAG